MEEKKRIRRTKANIEECIQNAAKELIQKRGFTSTLVTDVMKAAQIEPAVFYNRYENLESFYDEFVKKYDFWFNDILKNEVDEQPSKESYRRILKELLNTLKVDSIMLEILRWEIAQGNEITKRTATFRETQTLPLTDEYKKIFRETPLDIAALSAIIIGGIYYLCLHKDRSVFCEINLNTEEGVLTINKAIDTLSDFIFDYRDKGDSKLIRAAYKLKEKGVSADIIEECLDVEISFI